MKKSLLALAMLGAFAGTASAQSSVTIYGLLDLAIQRANGAGATETLAFNPGVNDLGGGPFGKSKAWFLHQSAASRLGFRGTEDLGGGLSAQFQIEHRFSPDDGVANSRFWFGRSYVQLTSAAAGSVYLGREYAPFFWLAAKSDPFGLDGVGQLTLMNYVLYGTHEQGANPTSRTQNTIGYRSPNIGGLTVNAAVGLGEGTLAGGRDAGFNIEYAGGPLYAAFGYDRKSGGVPAQDGNSIFNLALHYDFGVAKVLGYYGRSKTGVDSDATNKFFSIGVTAPVGPGKLKAAWGKLDAEGDDVFLDTTKFSIGYDYPLSRRTNLYADFGSAKSDADDVKTSRAFAFGVKHTF